MRGGCKTLLAGLCAWALVLSAGAARAASVLPTLGDPDISVAWGQLDYTYSGSSSSFYAWGYATELTLSPTDISDDPDYGNEEEFTFSANINPANGAVSNAALDVQYLVDTDDPNVQYTYSPIVVSASLPVFSIPSNPSNDPYFGFQINQGAGQPVIGVNLEGSFTSDPGGTNGIPDVAATNGFNSSFTYDINGGSDVGVLVPAPGVVWSELVLVGGLVLVCLGRRAMAGSLYL
jgi:hypothetical protein